jgi:hypothetical protein
MPSIAYFISPHGFGHATRAAAVMSAIQSISPEIHFDVFTQVPEWLFQVSVMGSFTYHNLACDIGVVQRSPLEEDLEATLQRLAAFIPFQEEQVCSLAGEVARLKCCLVICDIAPLGIAVASRAGLPSLLVENFTWDWIYDGYQSAEPRFTPYIDYLREIFQSVGYHIQTEPVSNRVSRANLVTPPAGRPPRLSRVEIRSRLGLPDSARVALLTMGGVQSTLGLSVQSEMPDDLYLVIPGAKPGFVQTPRCIPLPFHSNFYHPDLVAASDVIVGKAGYSTLAEAYLSGVPFVYLARQTFRETQSLTIFIQQELAGFEIKEVDFLNGAWLRPLVNFLGQPRPIQARKNGAWQIAHFILNLI